MFSRDMKLEGVLIGVNLGDGLVMVYIEYLRSKNIIDQLDLIDWVRTIEFNHLRAATGCLKR